MFVQYNNESPLKQKKKFDIYEMPNFEKLNNIYDQRQQKLSKPIGYLFFSKSFMTFAFVSIHRKRCYKVKKCLSCREILLNADFSYSIFLYKRSIQRMGMNGLLRRMKTQTSTCKTNFDFPMRRIHDGLLKSASRFHHKRVFGCHSIVK